MKKIYIILFILNSFISYSKFEKQFDLSLYENESFIKSYQTKKDDLSISIINLIEFKKSNPNINKLSNYEIFELFIEKFDNGKILESSNNVFLFKFKNKHFGGYHAMFILSKNEVFSLEGNLNNFDSALQYLRLNKKISELEESKYKLLLIKEKLN